MPLIFIISLVIYVIAGFVIYHNMYNFDKSEKIKMIILGFIVTLIMTTIICFISSNNINTENTQYISIIRNTSILLFSPINSIIFIPYIGNLLNKYKDNRLDEEQIKKRLNILAIKLILIVIFQLGYIKACQVGLLSNV